ncbi:MAG: flavodoxin [Eubacterium sp.]|nr:flavodoxin [Eubacterium sp.]
MSKVAVVYWSSTGNTEKMANEVLSGAKAAGAEADLIYATDFDAAKAASYDAIAFGCPAMGDEVLEDSEFQPMFDDVKNSLGGKKVALFGSYGWGDGDWMRGWEEDCKSCGITLAAESVICNEEPDDEGIAKCQALGKALA